jgi:hypothetical protein
VTERLQESELLTFHICSYDPTADQQDLLVEAFHKVYAARDHLRDIDRQQDRAE